MLLCALEQVETGMTLGASVPHPSRPETELLRAGVALDPNMLARVKRFGVTHVWVDCDLTADIDASYGDDASRARQAVCAGLKNAFGSASKATVSTANIGAVRDAMAQLTEALLSGRQFARLTERLHDAEGDLFAHSANVAFVATLIALSLDDYLIAERSRLAAHHAKDTVALGLAAVFHDIGKLPLAPADRERHEARAPDGPEAPAPSKDYALHTIAGFKALDNPNFPATARQAVLNHHQRFDGTGWPDLGKLTGKPIKPQEGKAIHVFTRILSAANVLDNLLIDAEGNRRPTVAALADFASPRFDGWFDPVIRDAALRHVPAFPVGALVELSDKRKAAVVSPNIQQPCRPTLRPIDPDSDGSLLELTEHPDVHIINCAGEHVAPFLFDLPTPREIRPAIPAA